MPSSDARDLLGRALLERLRGRTRGGETDPGLVTADLGLLRDAGYLKIAVPEAFGGAGLTLPQVACAQRRLAYHVPAAALAVNAHHAWVGAAADAHASGDSSADWLLREAAEGHLFAGTGSEARDLLLADAAATGGWRRGQDQASATSPGWDWLGVQAWDDSEPARPKILHAFIRRSGPGCRLARITPPGPPGDPFIAGVFGWGLPLDGELCYAIARRAFDLATEHVRRRLAAGRDADRYAADHGYPPGQWSLADAELRLESVRDQLDVVLHGWRERARAGGAVRTLDPGGQWLIRLFTVRHVAATGA
ncbi:MAG TPA: acyl-CoA dehydrogenase family protein, partial [Streptosporangiaceae bacterium]|nr:acyl-CoA dehydrogenase family protein [Streptosporangiaceae bacterium]